MEIQRNTEHLQKPYSVVELKIPEVERLQLGDTLAKQLGFNEDRRRQLEYERRTYVDARHVAILSSQGGIGDALCDMRQVRAMAWNAPDKEFSHYVPSPVAKITSFDLPPNMKVVDPRSAGQVPEDVSYIFSVSTLQNIDDYLVQAGMKLTNTPELSKPLFSSHRKAAEKLREVDVINETDLMNPENSHGDLFGVLRAKLLGVDISKQDLAVPLLKKETGTSSEDKMYDIVLVPDASEGIIQDTTDIWRSSKSLSIYQWMQLGHILPKQLRYAVVRGVSHSIYSNKVAEVLGERLKNIEYLKTASLNEYIELVSNSRRIFGMDSGTTHLASEVVRTSTSNNLVLREVFNMSLWDINEYGIRGLLPGAGKIMVADSLKTGTKFVHLPAEEIATFIID